MLEEVMQVSRRIRELREVCDYTAEDMAAEVGVDISTYESYESAGADIPISVLYHIARKCRVDFTEILTGSAARLSTYTIVERGRGASVDRYPGYRFASLAHKFTGKMMEPLLVTVDPSGHDPALVTHRGQEFNYVLEGEIEFIIEKKRFVLKPGDSVYFNPELPHGQRCHGETAAKFLTVIAE